MDQALATFPELYRRFAGADPTSTERGGLSVTRRLVDVARGHLALIGEAAGSVDAVTGDGLSLAFQQALALAKAIKGGNLANYTWEHSRLMRFPRTMSWLLCLLDGRHCLQNVTMRVLAANPSLFDRMLRMHVATIDRQPLAELSLQTAR